MIVYQLLPIVQQHYNQVPQPLMEASSQKVKQESPSPVNPPLRQGFRFETPPFEAKAPHTYSELEKRLRILAPFVLIPSLRYLQDDKEDRNRLFWRDFGSVFSGTMLYFTGVALYGKLATNVFKLPQKSKPLEFWSHIPAQVTSLTVAAFLGPKISKWLDQETRQVDAFFKNPNPINTVNEWWEEEGRSKRAKPHVESALMGAGLFTTLTALLFPLLKKGQGPKAETTLFDKALELWSVELPVLVTALEISVFSALKLDQLLVNHQNKATAKASDKAITTH